MTGQKDNHQAEGAPGAPRRDRGRFGHIFRAFLTFPRMLRMYPAGHQRVDAELNKLREMLEVQVATERRAIVIDTRGVSLTVNGEEVPGEAEQASKLALKLRRRRVKSIYIDRGITNAEILLLIEILGKGHKDLVREGGAGAILDGTPHPALGVSLIELGENADDPENKTRLPENIIAVLREILTSADTMERIERIRQRFAERMAEVGQERIAQRELFDQLVWDFFSKPDWERLEPRHVRKAVYRFLDLVEEAVDEVAPHGGSMIARIESIKSFFKSLSPRNLLEQEPEPPRDSPSDAVLYGTDDLARLVAELGEDVGSATDAVRNHLRKHDFQENSLHILCDLMVSSGGEIQYAERRRMFMSALEDNRYSSASIARILAYISSELPPVRFEGRDSLAHAVFDNTADVEALTLFLVGMADKPDVFRPILNRFAKQPNPFPLLVALLCEPHLESFRHILRDKLIEAAQDNQGQLRIWARQNRKAFFKKEAFETLFSEGTHLIGPICKEIIAEGPAQDRNHLIERLRQEGTESALRLLVLGMTQGDECDSELIHALSDFRHPLAVAALREVVHRCNTKTIPADVAGAALEALQHLGTEESWKFLWEVVQERACFLPVYRRELRTMATRAIEGRGRIG